MAISAASGAFLSRRVWLCARRRRFPTAWIRARCFARTPREAWRRDHGFAPGDLLVVSVARLEPQKNPAGAIEAFARAFGGRRAAAHLVWAGAGSLLEASRRQAAALGIERRVHFLGLCDDVGVPGLLSAVRSLPAGFRLGRISGGDHRGHGGAPARGGHGRGRRARTGGARRDRPAGCARRFPALAEALAALARDRRAATAWDSAAAARAARFDSAGMVEAYAALFERLCGRAPMKPRVVLLVTGLEPGGAETQVVQLAGELSRRGWEVSVDLARRIPWECARASPDPRALARLISLLNRLRPHILHSHLFHANLMARVVRLFCPCRW